MSELIPRDDVPDDEAALIGYLVGIVEEGRRVAAVRVNATLTMTYWLVGRAISVNTLRNGRAEYGKQILGSLSQELTARFGAGFDQSNLARMVAFARTFPDYGEMRSLAEHVTWTHIRYLLALKSDEARRFYVEEVASKHLSVRELRAAIARKAYERREIANSQIPEGSAVPRDTFRDPLILDTLGLQDTYLGLREGELLELRRSDIDGITGRIDVTRKIDKDADPGIPGACPNCGRHISSPKTRSGTRTVHVPPPFLPMLQKHLLEHTAPGPNGLLFPGDRTDHMSVRYLMDRYRPARTAARTSRSTTFATPL